VSSKSLKEDLCNNQTKSIFFFFFFFFFFRLFLLYTLPVFILQLLFIVVAVREELLLLGACMPCIPEMDLGRRLADFSAISWGWSF
jgi:hypothetical protein